MNERYEYLQSTQADRTVSSLMENRLKDLLDNGVETAQRQACQGCSHLALCGLAVNILRRKNVNMTVAAESLRAYGVQTDKDSTICPGNMVGDAIRRNENDEFWVLKADELSESSDDIKVAQAVERAAEDIAHIVNKKIII